MHRWTRQAPYSVRKFDDAAIGDVLLATANGKTYELIGKSKEKCRAIIAQKDFDGDGSIDALVLTIDGLVEILRVDFSSFPPWAMAALR
jgi:hypothetical protein